MLTARPLQVEDIERIRPHDYSAEQVKYILERMERDLLDEASKNGFSGFYDGRLIACGGFIPMWEGRASVWMIIDKSVQGASMLWVHRLVMEHLEVAIKERFHRIEMTVRVDFPQGTRWAEMLGFKFEALMEQYDPWRNDHILYARTR